MHKSRLWLTDRHYYHIKECSISSYDKEGLGDSPFTSPYVLDFTIEEDDPVIRLVIDNYRPRQGDRGDG